MSVFTPVSHATLEAWLKQYAIGSLVEHTGITAGVQNSNFFVDTTLGRYVLTIFEGFERADLPFYLNLMAHLSRHGLPVPAPVENRNNEYLSDLSDKPAALVSRLAGAWQLTPSKIHCQRIGAMLAGLHLAGQSYGRRLDNPRGHSWRMNTAKVVRPHLSAEAQVLLDSEVAAQHHLAHEQLPQGVIHADLFRNNVLWNGDHIGGVIDFYFAGNDSLLFDLAVTVNDWCSTDSGELDHQRKQALIGAYHAERPLAAREISAWPLMLRAAALRFWLSRLEDFHLPRSGEIVSVLDPEEYQRMLLARRNTPATIDFF